ncbi:MAG: aspartate aminotransferase family protein [Elusimicrobia bacterium]|nr:aspartate aminotransferase family protein [Elusimicrobiota bacterium]
MDLKQAKNMDEKYIFSTYQRQPLLLVKGKGSWVWDSYGNKYLDFFSGLAVNNLGNSHVKIVKAIKAQASIIMHTSNIFMTEPMLEVAQILSKHFGGKVFFCNSGAEANEAAIKLARKWGSENGEKYEIITMEESFHGRTLTTITATGQTKYQKGFEPLTPGFKYAKFNDLGSVQKLITRKTCAVMVEPIQGEGGVNIGEISFIKGLREICNGNNLLLIFDEVQTGIGRTGKLFAYEHFGVEPDIMTLAKALGGGLPIGAMLAAPAIAKYFKLGNHASTFGGNPVCCAAAKAVLQTIEKDKLLDNAARLGKILLEKLTGFEGKYKFVKEVRGKGLMIGIELEMKGANIVAQARDKGLLVNCAADKVIRLLPPITVKLSEIKAGVKILDGIFSQIQK